MIDIPTNPDKDFSDEDSGQDVIQIMESLKSKCFESNALIMTMYTYHLISWG